MIDEFFEKNREFFESKEHFDNFNLQDFLENVKNKNQPYNYELIKIEKTILSSSYLVVSSKGNSSESKRMIDFWKIWGEKVSRTGLKFGSNLVIDEIWFSRKKPEYVNIQKGVYKGLYKIMFK